MAQQNGGSQSNEELPEGTVLIAGGGPIGLLLALILAHHDIKSVLLERNKTTTKWPKMDLTNARSMEILRRLGLADEWRMLGVAPHFQSPVLISTGLWSKEAITRWELPSVDQFQERINTHNDGSQPREAWQRGSQAVFEKMLKRACDKNPLIDVRFGWRVESVEDIGSRVRTLATNSDTDETISFTSDFVAGCDGGSSKVRSSLSIPLDGGPIPNVALLVHFKSRDLARLHKQGQFWHIFFFMENAEFGGAIIAQDEIDTWTTHLFFPADADTSKVDTHDAVYTILGAMGGKFPIEIDEVLVRSTWRPNIAVTRAWSGCNGKVFLAGDSAHQSIPTGGYGMNMGIGDAYDLGWMLAAVIKGYAGPRLLESYEVERRPVALRNVEHSGVHINVHMAVKELLTSEEANQMNSESEEGQKVRQKLHDYFQEHDGENKDFGIEMGFRYKSPVIVEDSDGTREPEFKVAEYTPTTWPGGRPPHLFLSDGSSIFDKFGKDWTLVTFAGSGSGYQYVTEASAALSIPLTHVDLQGEELARKIWERDVVLVRPDEHVAWRCNSVASLADARRALEIAVGLDPSASGSDEAAQGQKPKEAFSATVEMTTQTGDFKLDNMGEMQK